MCGKTPFRGLIVSTIAVVALAASFLGQTTHARGIPEGLLGPVFRLFLQESPVGLEFASRVLGKQLSQVGGREYGQILQMLSLGENEAFTAEVLARTNNIETELTSRSILNERAQVAFIRSASLYEFRMSARPTEGAFSFATGETFVLKLPSYETTRAAFGAATAPVPTLTMPPEYAAQLLTNVGPDLRHAMESLRLVRGALQSDRMVMFLDGTAGATKRLLRVMESYVKATDRLTTTIAVAESRGTITADELRLIRQEIKHVQDHGVTREARRILHRDRANAEALADYLEAVESLPTSLNRVNNIQRASN